MLTVCRWGADHEHVTLSQFEDRVAKFKVNLQHLLFGCFTPLSTSGNKPLI